MVLNNKGLAFFYTLMMGITVIVLGIALTYPISEVINDNMEQLTCTAPANDWDEAVCVGLDLLKVLFIGGTIFAGIAILASRTWSGQ